MTWIAWCAVVWLAGWLGTCVLLWWSGRKVGQMYQDGDWYYYLLLSGVWLPYWLVCLWLWGGDVVRWIWKKVNP